MNTSSIVTAGGCLALLAGASWAQTTQRVSLDSTGIQANDASHFVSISADGRYVAFVSLASNLVPMDTNLDPDVFVRDRQTGATQRVSVSSSGAQGGNLSDSPMISADGRFVAFLSYSNNLVPGDTNSTGDIFVRDLLNGTTERVSVDSLGAEGDDPSNDPSISADGRWVAFSSLATNLVADDTNGAEDVFVHDRATGVTERVSLGSGGTQGSGASGGPAISADGRFVVFTSEAANLVAGDTNVVPDVFLRDRQAGTTERVSLDSSEVEGDNVSTGGAVSADGRCIAFLSFATNLVPGDIGGRGDVFLRDRVAGTTERINIGVGDAWASGDSFTPISISADGRSVAFASIAGNLVPGDGALTIDVFVRDRQLATTECVGRTYAGALPSGGADGPAMSADGRFVAFRSDSSDLVPGDTNALGDVFVRDREGSPFTSLCFPGVSGVLPCPCSNPPGSPNSGCDNSAQTGGAQLSALGGAFLSSDSLVFRTDGERPTALSILLQGFEAVPGGVVFGQGVRCASGSLKRLYAKSASAGSITAPNFAAGDPSVSQRSATLGDPIQAGDSRWYFVYYRDPQVLGGCPQTSTFNATQTGRVTWAP